MSRAGAPCSFAASAAGLLEVGAAAGLCLLPDRYGCLYGAHHVESSDVVFERTPDDSMPLPGHLPEVVGRAGIDLDPIDVTDDDAVRWPEAPVWPNQPEPIVRLRRAIEIARRDPPRVVQAIFSAALRPPPAEPPAQRILTTGRPAELWTAATPAPPS